MTYTFRREDTGELVEVPFDRMMQMDSLGCLMLDNGAIARRCHTEAPAKQPVVASSVDRPIISDALGFNDYQLGEFEADRKTHGFHGVEFVRDPMTPTFIQAKFNSKKEWERYIKHRGMIDKNSRNGSGGLGKHLFEQAQRRVREEFGETEASGTKPR